MVIDVRIKIWQMQIMQSQILILLFFADKSYFKRAAICSATFFASSPATLAKFSVLSA